MNRKALITLLVDMAQTAGIIVSMIPHRKGKGEWDIFAVSAGEYAGIVALDDVHGALSAGLGGFVASEGAVNVHMSTGEDLSVYAFGNVHGRYHA
ncbi:MAG: hypothetical protein ACQESR_27535, partial [Planctomycetota bacterium]